jgi:uncharacterized Fe-S center protein
MTVRARCMVCHQVFESTNSNTVDFFWNDELYSGLPVCYECQKIVPQNKHLNYDFRDFIKPIGLERWIHEQP